MKKSLKSTLIIALIAIYICGLGQSAGGFTTRAFAKDNSQIDLTVSQSYSGFKLASKKYIEDVQSTAYQFVHEKTGAKLIYLKNNDDNKVFSITFRTPPEDNTGVNHILEHTVLCGSDKYPVKDPFREMDKQSLKTYLNAMTYPDYTTFPVSSKNEKDFQNLMSVYLDAVFHPNIYKTENIFRQEGWRYELDSPKGELKLNGIVYNEMKGIYSSPSSVLSYVTSKSLFPQSIYGLESGGYPSDIPTLTYEKYLETHKRNYTPSNSYIYLYGNLDIEKTLQYINDNYLSKYDKVDIDTTIKEQKPFDKMKTVVDYYAVPTGSDTSDKTYLSLNYVVGKNTDKDTMLGLSILDELLMAKSSSPLRKALEDSGIGYNVSGSFNNYLLQPTYSIIVEGTNESQKAKFQKIVNDTLNEVVNKGFDKELVNSVFNSYEISMNKAKSSSDRGNNYADLIMKGWIYDQDPITYLDVNSDINNIKENISKKYFENLIQKYLLKNTHSSLVILKSKPGLDEQNAAELKKKLAAEKAKLSEQQINDIINKDKELKKWQERSDTPENLKTMPTLNISDINKKEEEIPTIIKDVKGVKVLNHPLYTSEVGYVNLYFDTTKVPQDKLMYLFLLSNVLGSVDTQKYKYTELSDAIDTYSGGISFYVDSYQNHKNIDKYSPKLILSISSLDKNLKNTLDITDEIMNNSKFTDKNHLKDLIKQIKSGLESDIQENARMYVLWHVQSYMSDNSKYRDLKCIPFYQFICNLEKDYDKNADNIIKNLQQVKDMAFVKDNLLVSFTGEEAQYKNFEDNFSSFTDKIKSSNVPNQTYKFDYSMKNEGFTIPSKVQYVAKGANFRDLGYEYSGKLAVLGNILDNEYVYQEVRVKNGAYGGHIAISNTNATFYSYRDPNLKETINAFDNAGKYLRNFNADDRQMTNYIIGAIGGVDGLESSIEKGFEADSMYITETTREDLQKYRDEILSTNVQDIRNYADMIDAVIKQNNIFVIGGEEKINAEKSIFKLVKRLLGK